LSGEEVSVSDAVSAMINRLRASERLRFDLLFGERPSRPYIIATFIGLLELIKLHIVSFEQAGSAAPIYLKLDQDDLGDAMERLAETYGGGAIPALVAQEAERMQEAQRAEEGLPAQADAASDGQPGVEEEEAPRPS